MSKPKLSNLSVNTVMSSIVKHGANILFAIGIVIMSYLSFVDNLNLQPSIRNLTTIALIAVVLNYMIWDSYYQAYYNNVIVSDISNENYCIHRRYYNARKNWTYEELQEQIRKFNIDFVNAWKQDVEDVTGRTIERIEKEPYYYVYEIENRIGKTVKKKRRYANRYLIYKVKHKLYPKSGIKTARDLLSVLSVNKSGKMKLSVIAAETHRTIGRVKKVIQSALMTGLAAALIYDFIDGNWQDALLKLLINVTILFMSFFFGATAGNKGGQIKLSIAEEVCERLEDWKRTEPSEVPFGIVQDKEIEQNESVVEPQLEIELE